MRIGNLYLHIGSCDGIVEDKLTAWIGVVKHSFDEDSFKSLKKKKSKKPKTENYQT
jgi:hypothetical protein